MTTEREKDHTRATTLANMEHDRRSGSSSPGRSKATVSLDVLPLHSTNLLTVLDENGVVRYESPSIERIYGFEQADLVGEQVAEYFHPEDRKDVVAAFETVVSGDETVEAVEYRHRKADGTYTWVESVASANPTPDGNYVINTRDISDRKEREQHLKNTNERLEEFASVVSHDLRNPLNVAQGRLELATEDSDSVYLDDVATAHERMEALITDFLTLSHAGNAVSETDSVSLEDLGDACWQTVSTADATLTIDTERHIRADRSRLRQLCENLIRNAVEHGGETVTVTIGETDSGFYVEDDGPGIPPRERTMVFEPGYSSTHESTGLGLSIVKQIVSAHDWNINTVEGGPRWCTVRNHQCGIHRMISVQVGSVGAESDLRG